jgi:two-component system phosphate regulon response regulator PhoB
VIPTILIVEDERDLANTVKFALEQEGWRTCIALDGRSALEAATRIGAPDLVLLDLMLPDMSGADVCRALRADAVTREVPIVILTARDDEIERIVSFEVGADDYVTKPFSMRELLLRIKAILRRANKPRQPERELVFGMIRLDPSAHRVWIEEDEVILTALEFRLLTAFIDRPGRVHTRKALLHDVWGHAPGLHTRTVDTHIQRLRKKLGSAATYIETLRGVGYRFRTTTDAGATD